MIVEDKDKALHYLSKLGYYRLSGYFYPFRQFDGSGRRADCFAEATYFNDVLALYMFDKALRVLAMDALERIEVAVKVEVAYLLGEHHALAHEDPTFFQKDSANFQHAKWLSNYQKLLNRENRKTMSNRSGKVLLYNTICIIMTARCLFGSGVKCGISEHCPIYFEVWNLNTATKLLKNMAFAQVKH